ncbi:CLUMA_CG020363, isoform A [Clunio marinus]|uniref:CLUMA_CG020363, isoform A n=1 Tax=Clunio marinus TaxID=568069 RepID=A0A1J1J4P8_9DIPT|nr:CLUMA_CG020363, isoform A [Clunio marinus]
MTNYFSSSSKICIRIFKQLWNMSSNHSSDTEQYSFDHDIVDSSIVAPDLEAVAQALNNSHKTNDCDDEDDDVILIPQHIETIDLCDQTLQSHQLALNDNSVIVIPDSQDMKPGPSRRRPRNIALGNDAIVLVNDELKTVSKRLNFDDSHEEISNKKAKITCPICFESVVDRKPVSTICGHLFCRSCLEEAFMQKKICPMCKKHLARKGSYHEIYLNA